MPVEAEACPMPANHRLRCDDDQSFFPSGPELMGNDPEQFVEQIEPWPRMSTFQNGELLPKREILQHKLAAVTKRRMSTPNQSKNRLYMSRGYSRPPSEPGL
jgi:hypothetical protein